MEKATKILRTLMSIKWKYFFFNFSLVFCKKGGKLKIGKKVKMFKCKIIINDNGSLIVDDETMLKDCVIRLAKQSVMNIGKQNIIANMNLVDGECLLGNNNYLMKEAVILVENHSSLKMGNNNRFFGTLWLRFSGRVKVGDFNTINQRSEIRCDEAVVIGDYNQISMSNHIWDTNTHRIFNSVEDYKSHIITHFPNFNEDGKPKTRPVEIGNCNWLGEDVFIKSSKIGNHNIIGYRTSVINKLIDDDNTVTNCLEYRIFKY